MSKQSRITAVILSYNEEKNMKRCIDSVAGWCEVIVVDSFSTDETVHIATGMGAHVIQHTYENHSAQWNWILDRVTIDTDWILALDADFIVTPELKKALDTFLNGNDTAYNGFYVKHEYVFWGSRIRFGGIKKYWLRGLRLGYGNADASDLVDFRFNVKGGVQRINAKVIESNEKDSDFSFWVRKQDLFSFRLAVEEEVRRRKLINWEGKKSLFGNTDEKFKSYRDIWMSMPLFIRPWFYFFYRYIIALGFLDGVGGFIYHFQQGLWLRMVVDMKIRQIRKARLSNEFLLTVSREMLTVKSGSLEFMMNYLKDKASVIKEEY